MNTYDRRCNGKQAGRQAATACVSAGSLTSVLCCTVRELEEEMERKRESETKEQGWLGNMTE